MANEPVFLFLGVYDDPDVARADLEVVRELHHAGVVGTYDAAVAVKDDDGDVHVDKWEKPTQHGAWWGIGVGAAIGVLFPPSILAAAAVGGVTGGLIGHFARGMSRKDVKELGETLDEGQACLLVIGKNELMDALEKADLKALKKMERKLDIEAEVLDKELAKAAKDAG